VNLILLSEQELANAPTDPSATTKKILTLSDRRAKHIIDILKAEPGNSLKAGIINGNIGQVSVTSVDKNKKQLTVIVEPQNFNSSPPTALNSTLIFALPRPKMAKRIMQMASECGVKTIHFINSFKVEKSYWSSPLLEAEAIHHSLLLGLEQSVDTQLPQVYLHKRFKPFVEDNLPSLINQQQALVLHPYAEQAIQSQPVNNRPMTIVMGPEGGFIPFEIDKLQQAGCLPVSWGPRIQRSETMLGLLLGRLSTAT